MTEYFENKEKETLYNLCVNTECLRYPDDKDFVIEEESDYVCDEWQKCSLCDGYFIDDGLNDILFIEEEPNNSEGECDLCGKTTNIVQLKSTGEYLCGNGCDESDNEIDNESG